MLTIFVIILIPIYARWWAWYGGITFGPRFFLVGAIPGAMAVANWLESRETSCKPFLPTLAATLSTWVAIAGVVFAITPMSAYRCMTETYRYEPLCWYSAEYSSLLAPYWDHAGKPILREWVFILSAVATLIICVVPALERVWRHRSQTSGAFRIRPR